MDINKEIEKAHGSAESLAQKAMILRIETELVIDILIKKRKSKKR